MDRNIEKSGKKKTEKTAFFVPEKQKTAKNCCFLADITIEKMAYLSQKIRFIQEVGKFER